MNSPNAEISVRINFLLKTEKLKSVHRQTSPAYLERPENSAEHSWSLAIMAILFADLADEPLCLERMLEIVAVHDLVEIHAGDTFCYDEAANVDKAEREQAAANTLFGCLPDADSARFHSLWEEFESGVTAEARFTDAMDRLLPLLQNRAHLGRIWQKQGITKGRVLDRIKPIAGISVGLHIYACDIVEESVRSGWLPDH